MMDPFLKCRANFETENFYMDKKYSNKLTYDMEKIHSVFGKLAIVCTV